MISAILHLDGQAYSFDEIRLVQEVVDSHHLEVDLQRSDLQVDNLLDASRRLKGKPVEVEINHGTKGVATSFKGKIRGVSQHHLKRGEVRLRLMGSSPEQSMKGGPRTRSFSNMSLRQIADQVSAPYQNAGLSIRIDPVHTESIPYVVQYKESDWNFLARLALEYGEHWYQDGQQLHFGRLNAEQPLELSTEVEIDYLEVSVSSAPQPIRMMGYDYTTHQKPEVQPPSPPARGDLATASLDSPFYQVGEEAVIPVNRQMAEGELKALNARLRDGQLQETVLMTGVINVPGLKIGGLVRVVDAANQITYDDYRVITLNQEVHKDGAYQCRFTAVPKATPAPALHPEVQTPEAEGQVAEVVDNNDPNGLGRIQVRFHWQEADDTELPWIMVPTSYPASSDFPDKGNYVRPEIKDMVRVEFEHGDPDKPYMLSAFYHGEAKPVDFDPENKFKVFRTRRGNLIRINDEEGKEEISISNPEEKNVITLSAADDGAITIISAGAIRLEAPEIELKAEKSIHMDVNGSQKLMMDGSGSGSITVETSGKLEQKGMDVNIEAKKALNASGTNVKIEGKAAANLEAKGPVSVKGLIINLNS